MPRHRKWSEEDIAKLNSLARRYPAAQIAAARWGRSSWMAVWKQLLARSGVTACYRLRAGTAPGPKGCVSNFFSNTACARAL
jgi:hypothetical protein